jgi:hypothetical protein
MISQTEIDIEQLAFGWACSAERPAHMARIRAQMVGDLREKLPAAPAEALDKYTNEIVKRIRARGFEIGEQDWGRA